MPVRKTRQAFCEEFRIRFGGRSEEAIATELAAAERAAEGWVSSAMEREGQLREAPRTASTEIQPQKQPRPADDEPRSTDWRSADQEHDSGSKHVPERSSCNLRGPLIAEAELQQNRLPS